MSSTTAWAIGASPTEALQSSSYSSTEAARYIGGSDFPVSTLRYWRCAGGGPRFLKLGHVVRYRVEDLNDFIEQCLRSNTSELHSRGSGHAA